MTEDSSHLTPSGIESQSADCDLCVREGEQRFRTTFENAAVGIALMSPEGRWLTVNHRLSEILGYSAGELAGKIFADITHPDDLAVDLAQRRRMLSGAISHFSLEKRYIRKNGSPIWVNLTVGCVRKDDGSVDHFITMVEDISKRKEAEALLRASEDRLRRVLNNLFAFVGVLSREGILAEVNDAPVSIARLSRDDVIGKPFWDCFWWGFSEESQSRLRESLHRALQGETIRYDVDMRIGERRFIAIDFQLAPLKNEHGGVVEIIASGTDITGRKRVEARLRESEADLQLAQEAASLGRWHWDLQTQALVWTDRCKALFGWPADAAVTYPMFLASVYPEDREKIETAIASAVEHGSDYDVEMRTVWPDGSLHWIASKGRVYFDGGLPSRMVGVAFEVTARKQAEEQMSYVLREVDHRAKNLLSVVQAIVRQTARTETTGEFVELFSERLRGLAASQDLLVGNGWKGVALLDLVRSQLAHFKDALETRVKLSGPDVELSASAAQTIGMVIHELATNAAKYGALSNDVGRVFLDWSLREGEDGPVFEMTWSEHGGPPVSKPSRKGFGRKVLQRMAQDALGADVALDYERDGLRWRLCCPAGNALKA